LQPELEKIKAKHKTDPQGQIKAMQALWKKNGVNPSSAFVPIIIQMPVLIALFFVIKSGLMPHNSYLLYPFMENFDYAAINFQLFYLDLRLPDPFLALPIVVGLTQFVQMKTMQMSKAKLGGPAQTAMMMNMMTYGLPIIVVVFGAKMPAAVSLYWLISTIFAVGQQWVLKKD